MSNSSVSIAIVTKNRPHEVVRCVKSVLNQTRLPDEVIIIDSSNTNKLGSELQRLLRHAKPKIVYIHTMLPTVRARNLATEKCASDIIIFLDDDVVLTPTYVEEVERCFAEDRAKKISAITGLILNEGCNMVKPFSFVNQVLRTMFFLPRYGIGRVQPSGSATIIRKQSRIVGIEYLHGSNMAFRKELLLISRFDEHLQDEKSGYTYAEDDEIALRLSKRFWVVFNPYAKLSHNPSTVRSGNYIVRKKILENHYYIFKKHFPQTLKYKVAFYWSMLGWFVIGILTSTLKRDSNGLNGLVEGLRNVYNGVIDKTLSMAT